MQLDRRRYTRQIRLADVGEAGQARLSAAEVALVTTGFARSIEERYVRGAGMHVRTEARQRGGPAPEVTMLGLRHGPAREVAEGALSALVAFRAALAANGGGES